MGTEGPGRLSMFSRAPPFVIISHPPFPGQQNGWLCIVFMYLKAFLDAYYTTVTRKLWVDKVPLPHQ